MRRFLLIFIILLFFSINGFCTDEWVSPTGFNDPDTAWNNEPNAYDDNLGTATDSAIGTDKTWGGYIELEIDEIICKRIRYFADLSSDITKIDIDLYYNDVWNDLYEGVFADQVWEERSMVNYQYVTKARVRFYAKKAATAYLYEFEFEQRIFISSDSVAFVNNTEVKADGEGSITMGAPVGTSVDDLLIAYISKDDDVTIDTNGAWTELVNDTAGTGNCLYVAWRIATVTDGEWTWTADPNEDWLGEILCYSGVDTTNPIHNSDYTVQGTANNTPVAPSVQYGPHWVSPTDFVDPDTAWTDEIYAYDEQVSTWAQSSIAADSWGSYIELTIDPVSCDKVRFRANYHASYIDQVSLDVYYDSAWNNIYEGVFEPIGTWTEKAIGSTETVTAVRMKFANEDSQARNANLYEVDFGRVLSELTAGSMVFQCFGCDDDDDPYTMAPGLTSRFNTTQVSDVGGAGGDMSSLLEWISPTGFVDSGGTWTNEDEIYDDDTGANSYGGTNIPTESWSDYVELTHSGISCLRVRFWATWRSPGVSIISLDVYYSAGWHNIYEGDYIHREWVEKEIGSVQTVTAMQAKFYNSSDAAPWDHEFYEADFGKLGAAGTLEGTGETGIATFAMSADEQWVAATVVIEAGEIVDGWEGPFNTKTISKWNTKELSKWNTIE